MTSVYNIGGHWKFIFFLTISSWINYVQPAEKQFQHMNYILQYCHSYYSFVIIIVIFLPQFNKTLKNILRFRKMFSLFLALKKINILIYNLYQTLIFFLKLFNIDMFFLNVWFEPFLSLKLIIRQSWCFVNF